MSIKDGKVNLADGTKLKLKMAIFDVREAGFSPYGGVNIAVNSTCGIKVENMDLTTYNMSRPNAEQKELLDRVGMKHLLSSDIEKKIKASS